MEMLSINKRIDLFISILISILISKIKFPRTKEQPLLPNQTLMQPNKFKTIFIQFLNHFNVQFDSNNVSPTRLNKVYKNDKQRSNKISKLFVSSLQEIKNNLFNKQNLKLFTEQTALEISKKLSTSSTSKSSVTPSTINNKNNNKNRNYHIQSNKNIKKLHPTFNSFNIEQEIKNNDDINISISNSNNNNNNNINNNNDDEMTQSIDSSSNNDKFRIDSSCCSLSDVSSEYDNNYKNNNNNNNNYLYLETQPLYSVMVPLNNNNAIEYQFLSFSPLFVKQNMLSSSPQNY